MEFFKLKNKNYLVFSLILAFSLILFSSTGVLAASNSDPVGAGSILRSGVDARALGMGGAFVAIANNYAASYWNPAGVTRANSIYLGGMNQDKFGLGLNLNYLSGGIPLTNLPFGVNSPFSAIPLIDNLSISGTYNGFSTNVKAAGPDGNPIGDITYSERIYMGTTGFSLPGIGSIGMTGKNYRFRAPNAGVDGKTATANGFGFDLGLLAEPLDNFWIGAAGFDLTGTPIKWKNTPEEPTNIAPTRYSAGAAYNLDTTVFPIPNMMAGTATFAGQYTFGPNITNKIRSGIEYNFSIFALRGGLIRSQGGVLEFTAGAGLNVNLLSADVAWVQNNSVEAENTSDTIILSTEFSF